MGQSRSRVVTRPVLAITLCLAGCGSKSQLEVAVDSAAPTDSAADSSRPDRRPTPIDTSPPMRRMTCVEDDSFGFIEGEVAGETIFLENGFSGGNRDGGKCAADWELIFTDQRCIEMGVDPVPSLRISIRGDPLFMSGVSYTGEATFLTEGGAAVFPVEVVADELSEPELGGRASGFIFAEDFPLFGEFDLVMDPDLVPDPFCA